MAKKARKAGSKKGKKSGAKKTAKKPKTKRKSTLVQTTCTLSADLQAVVGAKTATRPQVVKKLWAYIKAHKCQDTKNRRMINPDKKLATVIGNRPVDMLKLAGLLSKHIKK